MATPSGSKTASSPAPTLVSSPSSQITRGLLLGLLGVCIFALTMPMTRLAVGDQSAPQLPPWFVTVGRAAVAGLLSLAYVAFRRAALPERALWPAIAVSAICTVVGFPLGLAMALREVPAMHASVVSGVIPLFTAVAAAIALRQRASLGFWACAVFGCALVLAFAWISGGGRWVLADAWLLAAVVSAAVGYVSGSRVSAKLGAELTICWVLVLSLPFTLPAAVMAWPSAPARASAWMGFAYVSLFSMWIGFFAWYRGMNLGGVMRVSQVQLAQPFLALLAAVPLLGEPLNGLTVGFALAVLAVIVLSRRMALAPVQRK